MIAPLHRIVVLLPTYNERDNLPVIVSSLRTELPRLDICVLDDNSPDGTGAVADELASRDPAISVIHRVRKEGLGAAYLAGFAWAIDAGYDAVVEMDADGSHQVADLRVLLEAAERTGADLMIGSRWVPGGEVVNWPLRRKALSMSGNTYAKLLLGMPVNDATAGFRVYRIRALQQLELESVRSSGYCFQVDLTVRALRAGLQVREVPITFVERVRGESKMSSGIVRESMVRITGWGVQYRLGRVRERLRRAPR